ncbi:non-specific lipid transfer protein GPI-anchored 5-like [Zingiber officinale]|uniref:non-specific lipid transfer protein GPI-anchored 5-like n=1 Tax=Zingiber officinale TaxID=94328 RepID=UPI001C4C39EC|nr:non-specific lipid transfer protein GPI-anchored 5-like [Zingiber officinale]
MGHKHELVAVAGFIVAVLLGTAAAQSSAGCTSAIIGLAPCLNYITGNATAPSPACCSQLATVVQSQPACLCSVLNGGGSSFGVSVNQTRALAMPGACKVQTPPVSECNAGAKSPTPSPATPEAPADPAPATPSTISPPRTEGGSKATPATPATASDAVANKSPATLILSIFFFFIFIFLAGL